MPKFTFHGEQTVYTELEVEADTFNEAVTIMQTTPYEKWDEHQADGNSIINACNTETGLWTEWQEPGWSDWFRT